MSSGIGYDVSENEMSITFSMSSHILQVSVMRAATVFRYVPIIVLNGTIRLVDILRTVCA